RKARAGRLQSPKPPRGDHGAGVEVLFRVDGKDAPGKQIANVAEISTQRLGGPCAILKRLAGNGTHVVETSVEVFAQHRKGFFRVAERTSLDNVEPVHDRWEFIGEEAFPPQRGYLLS